MIKIGKIRIHSSFLFFMFLAFVFKRMDEFFVLVIVTTLHELSHVLAAKALKMKIEYFVITSIGEVAYIDGFDLVSSYKRIMITVAGPLFNAVCAVASALAFGFIPFTYINIAIGIFNLLPIYPLDGGKILFILAGNRFGILNGIKVVERFTVLGIAALYITGFVQLIVYPFNASILAVSLFMTTIFRKEKNEMIFSFFRCIINKSDKVKKTKSAVFDVSANLQDVMRVFTWDYFHLIAACRNEELAGILTEKQIIDELLRKDT